MVCSRRSWFYLASVTKQTLFEHFLSGLRDDFWEMLRKNDSVTGGQADP